MVKIIDAEFEEIEPEKEKKPDKKWSRESFNFCACMLAAIVFSRVLGLFIYGQ